MNSSGGAVEKCFAFETYLDHSQLEIERFSVCFERRGMVLLREYGNQFV